MKSYPVKTPQGATVLIYAHESGVTLLWRGGRRLKSGNHGDDHASQNGTNSADAVMIIDSDDETSQPASTDEPDKPDFEEAVADDAASFPDVIQTLDLSLGTAALHIAVLPMPPSTPDAAASGGAPILKDRMVFAVACATGEIYLVTIPLAPPSHQYKAKLMLKKDLLATRAGKGTWGETLTSLSGQSRHSDGLALSLVSKQQKSSSDRSRSRDRSDAEKVSATRVVVASHTRETSGTLRFWDVTLESKAGRTAPADPFQTEYLPAPLTGISFNPSQTTQLLAITSPAAARIYDYSIPSLPEDISEGPFPTQGSWLLSLYPPFARGSVMSTSRKPIIAADWIAHGRAVLTLLADGQWGIWNIGGAHPSPNSTSGTSGLFNKDAPGLRGAALTNFSVTGYLEGTSPLRNPVSHKSPSVPGSGGDFVPMTPHTRRDALAASMTGGPEKLAAVKGGIAILKAQPLKKTTAPTSTDESAVLWLGGADPIVAVIPAVSRFWDAQLRRGVGGGVNLFSGAQPTRMIRLADLGAGLLGERCTGVEAVVRENNHSATSNGSTPVDDTPSSTEGLPIDVLIQGESRLIVVRGSDDGTSSDRLLGLHKKKRVSDRSTSAIIAYPRPEKPSSVAFNLSVSRAGNLGRSARQRAPVKGLFEPQRDQLLPSTEVDEEARASKRPRPVGAGFAFAQSMSLAADASDNEEETEERDVEAEMLDIMEIDRELEEMENERDSGRKHVFFEGA